MKIIVGQTSKEGNYRNDETEIELPDGVTVDHIDYEEGRYWVIWWKPVIEEVENIY